METARILAALHDRLQVVPVPALREISHGHWEGRKRSEVERLFPDEYRRWESDPFSFAPEGGETGLAVTARALPATLELLAAHADAEVLIVSHKATIRLLICSFLGLDPRSYRDRLDQSPASLNVVDFGDLDRPRLMLFNDTSHHAADPSGTPGTPGPRLSKWWDHGAGDAASENPRTRP
jgi:probable phosphoglycerate mutase